MKSLTVLDAGHRFTVGVKEGPGLALIATDDVSATVRFLNWWRGECDTRGIPYAYRVAEPQGHRIIRQLLKKHSLERLQELARHFFLDHGDKLRENPNHFALFTSMLGHMEAELQDKE